MNKDNCTEPEFLTFKEPKNRFQGTNSARLCSLAGRYDNPIPTRFLAPIECLKIPAQYNTSRTRLGSKKQYIPARCHPWCFINFSLSNCCPFSPCILLPNVYIKFSFLIKKFWKFSSLTKHPLSFNSCLHRSSANAFLKYNLRRKILGHDVPTSNTYDRTEKSQGRIVLYGGDVFKRVLFLLASDMGPYQQKFENVNGCQIQI